MRIWWILLGLVAVIGLLFWFNPTRPEETAPSGSPPSSAEEMSPAGAGKEGASGGAQEHSTKTPEELLADLQPYLCEEQPESTPPMTESPTLTVAAPCVRVEGLFMFGSRLPQTGDYLLKIWPTKEYLPLITACGALSPEGVPPSRELVVIVKGEDWPKVEPILQPEGHFRYALSVRVEGPYVYSTETNRHVYTPHCEIHPLQLLVVLEEPQGEGKGNDGGSSGGDNN